MDKYNAQQVMNGTYMAEVTAFEAKVSINKTDVNMTRRLAKVLKVTGFSCSIRSR